jgi:hypothetical protein
VSVLSSVEESFKDLPAELIEALDAQIRHEIDQRGRTTPTDVFPWHKIQSWVLHAPELVDGPTRILMVTGGNRSGKTKVLMGMYSNLLRRQSALNKQLITTDRHTGEVRVKDGTDPLSIWVVPPTLEKARQDWMNPSDRMGLKYWAGDLFVKYERSPDHVLYTRTPDLEFRNRDGGIDITALDKTILKSQDQDLYTFESSEVDAVFIDEEFQDRAKFTSCLMRIATSNGFIAMGFTPLKGMTWTYHRWWKPLVKQGKADCVEERCYIYKPPQGKGSTVVMAQMGARDNPRAKAYAEEIENDPGMTEAEKNARLIGEYGFVEGALVPALAGIDVTSPLPEHVPYVVDRLPGEKIPGKQKVPGRIIDWYLVADPNKSYGAILGALDGDGNIFLVTDHLERSWSNKKHAAAFTIMEKTYAGGSYVHRYADPGSAGAQSMVDLAEEGMNFLPVPKGAGSVSASVKRLRSLAWVDPNHTHPITGKKGSPRIFFYRPGMVKEYREDNVTVVGCRTAEQISEARQTSNESAPPDTPHKTVRSKLDLFDCVRYIAMLATSRADEDDDEERIYEDDMIPSDDELFGKKGEGDDNPLDVDFALPDYAL